MPLPLKVLIAEDSSADAELALRELRRAGFTPDWKRVDTETAYLEQLHAGLDLVLSDYEMPQFSGLRALELLKQSGLDIPFIIVSGTIGEDTAVAAMKLGAVDYLLKDRLTRLGQAVSQAMEQGRLRRERTRVEVVRRESEERLRIVTENAQVGLVLVNPERRYAFVNATYCEMFGVTAAIIDQRVADVLDPRYEQQVRPFLSRALAGERVTFEARRATPTGTRDFAVSYEPTKQGKTVTMVVVVVTDITDLKQAEKALVESQQRYREMMENLELISIALDRSGLVTFCNDYFLRLTGWTRDDVVGHDWFDRFIPTEQSALREFFRDCIQRGTIPPHRDNPIKTRTGEVREIAWNNTVLRDADGAVIGSASIGEDVTIRRLAEQKIREQLDELLRWQEVMLNREDRVSSLKVEVNDLLVRQGQPPRYEIPLDS